MYSSIRLKRHLRTRLSDLHQPHVLVGAAHNERVQVRPLHHILVLARVRQGSEVSRHLIVPGTCRQKIDKTDTHCTPRGEKKEIFLRPFTCWRFHLATVRSITIETEYTLIRFDYYYNIFNLIITITGLIIIHNIIVDDRFDHYYHRFDWEDRRRRCESSGLRTRCSTPTHERGFVTAAVVVGFPHWAPRLHPPSGKKKQFHQCSERSCLYSPKRKCQLVLSWVRPHLCACGGCCCCDSRRRRHNKCIPSFSPRNLADSICLPRRIERKKKALGWTEAKAGRPALSSIQSSIL